MRRISPPPLRLGVTGASAERYGSDRLAELRRRIARADRQLVAAIARRLDEVEKVQRWKRSHGLSPDDPAQELEVVRRARLWAEEAGVRAAVVEEVVLILLDEGRRRRATSMASELSGSASLGASPLPSRQAAP